MTGVQLSMLPKSPEASDVLNKSGERGLDTINDGSSVEYGISCI
ncbi:hypothetical protein [Zarconia navalis]|nr:hypothetical protein [Zarconia navalis]